MPPQGAIVAVLAIAGLLTNLASVAMGFSLFSSNVSYPQLLELPPPAGFGLTLLAASLIIMPSGPVMMVLSPFSGRMARTVGPRRLLVFGATALVAAYAFSLLLASEVWHILVANLLIGVGIVGAVLASLSTVQGGMQVPTASAFQLSFALGLAAAVVALIVAAFIPQRPAAETHPALPDEH